MREVIGFVSFVSIGIIGSIYLSSVPAYVSAKDKIVELRIVRSDSGTPEKFSKPRGQSTLLPFRSSICSGFFIDSSGDILTAGHCAPPNAVTTAVLADGQQFQAILVATSPYHDLAFFHIDKRNTPYFRITEGIKVGEQVWILGSPLGITNTLSTGIVAKFDGDQTLLDCSALPGNSGSPVFDKRGELVGVLTAGYVVMFGTTHLTIAQGTGAIWEFITHVKKENTSY